MNINLEIHVEQKLTVVKVAGLADAAGVERLRTIFRSGKHAGRSAKYLVDLRGVVASSPGFPEISAPARMAWPEHVTQIAVVASAPSVGGMACERWLGWPNFSPAKMEVFPTPEEAGRWLAVAMP